MENRICGVIANVFDSGTVGRVFDLRSGQTKGYEIGTCYLPIKHAALKHQRHVYLQTVVSASSHYNCPIKGVGSVQSEYHHPHHHRM